MVRAGARQGSAEAASTRQGEDRHQGQPRARRPPCPEGGASAVGAAAGVLSAA